MVSSRTSGELASNARITYVLCSPYVRVCHLISIEFLEDENTE